MTHNIRLRFSKSGGAVYISHLDLNRTMQRALHRARVDIAYTEGFNPHPYLVFAMPLSLGFEGQNEILDIRILSGSTDALPGALNAALPDGLRITDVYSGGGKLADIAFARYEIRLTYDTGPEPMLRAVNDFFAAKELIVEKKTKKGRTMVDIAGHIGDLTVKGESGCVMIGITLPCSLNFSINPSLYITKLMEANQEITDVRITRLDFYTNERAPFH